MLLFVVVGGTEAERKRRNAAFYLLFSKRMLWRHKLNLESNWQQAKNAKWHFIVRTYCSNTVYRLRVERKKIVHVDAFTIITEINFRTWQKKMHTYEFNIDIQRSFWNGIIL